MNTVITIDEKMKEQIEHLARLSGKPEKTVVQEVMEAGLKTYTKPRRSAARVLLEIADYAKKIGATGPKDLSTNHDTYLYGE